MPVPGRHLKMVLTIALLSIQCHLPGCSTEQFQNAGDRTTNVAGNGPRRIHVVVLQVGFGLRPHLGQSSRSKLANQFAVVK